MTRSVNFRWPKFSKESLAKTKDLNNFSMSRAKIKTISEKDCSTRKHNRFEKTAKKKDNNTFDALYL